VKSQGHTRALLEERAKRSILGRAVLRALHAKQRAFATNKAKRVAAHCGRRSGKSHGIAGKFFLTAIANPGRTSVFIAISVSRANEIIERAFRILARKVGWGPRPTKDNGQVYWVFPNGHKVWCAGCKNKSEAEKFRGDPYCGAAVDEADSLRGHLQYLVEDVLEAALLDFDGWLALLGTPGVTPAGYFHDVTTGSNGQRHWATYHWTVLDNPFLPNAARWLTARREVLGLSEDSPTYRREWLGQWIADLDSLVYAYDPSRNDVTEPIDNSRDEWRFFIGVDLGVTDATAFVAGAYRPSNPELHALESQSWVGLGPSSAYVKLREWMLRYPKCRVVADTGGQGKAFAKEWADMHQLFVEPAMKLDVVGQVAFVNGMLRSGVCKIHQPGCRTLTHEMSQLPWNENRDGHEQSYPDHECDAFRYLVLAMRPNYKAELEPPIEGTAEWHEAQSKARKDKAIADSMKRRRVR
jgi:hypothetical protein